jgi:ribonuclease D
MSKSKVEFLWVNTPQALDHFINNLRGYFPIALDTEADSLHHYRESVCLIQVTHDSRHFLVDPLGDFPLDELWPPTSRHTWILHGADFDLRMLRRAGAPEPQAVFDTMLAAQLLGLKAFGYGALVEKFCGVTLNKTSQKADWSRRPLSAAMIEYAVQDTEYLEPIAEMLGAQLDEKKRREWHEQSCARVVEASRLLREEDPETEWRLSGSALLSPQALAIVKELYYWREKEAEMVDLPVFKVLHTELLLDLAAWSAENPRVSPMGAPRWPQRMSPARAERLIGAIDRGREAPPIPRPPRGERPPRDKEAEVRMEKLRVHRDAIAADLAMDPTVIAAKSILQDIARNPDTGAARLIAENRWCAWQWELLKPGLQAPAV